MQHNFFTIKAGTAVQAVIVIATAFATTGVHSQSANMLERLTGKSKEPVDPALAFSVVSRKTGSHQITLDFSVRPDYYLYRERISVTLKDSPSWHIKQVGFPPATIKVDKTFGRSPVYEKYFSVPVDLAGKTGTFASLLVTYQGCFEPIGVCYPPETLVLKTQL